MAIVAPYNFVPLSQSIFLPPWAGRLAHDTPFRRGLSGDVRYTITAHTPILVGAGREQQGVQNGQARPAIARPFRLPDGRYAIPGSSIRGMTRNVVEIASFARMRLVDDRRYGLRDLTGGARIDYNDRMTGKRDGGFAPKAGAGWLYYSDGRWRIQRCAFARLDHDQLAGASTPAFVNAFATLRATTSQDARAAPRIYELWAREVGLDRLQQDFDIGESRVHQHHGNLRLTYRRALATSGAAPPRGYRRLPGTLVFTGQPSSRKHMEFVLFDEGDVIDVPAEVWAGFIDVHENSEKESATWAYWRERYRAGDTDVIPVFFLTDGAGVVESLGLAMMYKKAHKHTVHQLIAHTSAAHLAPRAPSDGARPPPEAPDLAELVLGRIGASPGETLKGRVSFGLAVAEGNPREEAPATVVLGAPKPSYFPCYVRQTDLMGGAGDRLYNKPETRSDGRRRTIAAEYKSYMDGKGNAWAAAEIRGWKRYHPHRAFRQPQPPGPDVGVRAQTVLRPLAAGARFTGRLRFHNLLPEELGAIVWALTWGGEGSFRHGLGTGKSLGYGQVSIALDDVRISANAGDAPTLEDCRDAYVALMEAWAASPLGLRERSWKGSLQIAALEVMADPGRTPDNVRHMRIAPNEFQTAKSNGDVLPEPPGCRVAGRNTDERKMKLRG